MLDTTVNNRYLYIPNFSTYPFSSAISYTMFVVSSALISPCNVMLHSVYLLNIILSSSTPLCMWNDVLIEDQTINLCSL